LNPNKQISNRSQPRSKNNKANITARIKEIKGDIEAKEEEKILKEWLKLNDRQTALKKEIKEAEVQIDRIGIRSISNPD
jgi:hypothetical protein